MKSFERRTKNFQFLITFVLIFTLSTPVLSEPPGGGGGQPPGGDTGSSDHAKPDQDPAMQACMTKQQERNSEMKSGFGSFNSGFGPHSWVSFRFMDMKSRVTHAFKDITMMLCMFKAALNWSGEVPKEIDKTFNMGQFTFGVKFKASEVTDADLVARYGMGGTSLKRILVAFGQNPSLDNANIDLLFGGTGNAEDGNTAGLLLHNDSGEVGAKSGGGFKRSLIAEWYRGTDGVQVARIKESFQSSGAGFLNGATGGGNTAATNLGFGGGDRTVDAVAKFYKSASGEFKANGFELEVNEISSGGNGSSFFNQQLKAKSIDGSSVDLFITDMGSGNGAAFSNNTSKAVSNLRAFQLKIDPTTGKVTEVTGEMPAATKTAYTGNANFQFHQDPKTLSQGTQFSGTGGVAPTGGATHHDPKNLGWTDKAW